MSIQSQIAELPSRASSGLLVKLVDKILGGGSETDPERERLESRLVLARMRKSPPRCLRCGGVQIQDVVKTTHSWRGRLYVLPDDAEAPRFSCKPQLIALDVEGYRLG